MIRSVSAALASDALRATAQAATTAVRRMKGPPVCGRGSESRPRRRPSMASARLEVKRRARPGRCPRDRRRISIAVDDEGPERLGLAPGRHVVPGRGEHDGGAAPGGAKDRKDVEAVQTGKGGVRD